MTALAIDLDALADTRRLWTDWLADATRRFGSIAPLDASELPHDRARAAEALDRWAAEGVGDWRSVLERFAEDRAPVYVRPDAATSAILRRLQAAGVRLGVFTDAPAGLARVALAHVGAARRIEAVEAGDAALERLLARLGGDAQVVRSREDLLGLA
jgi:phosphoglycolate phosphatase-like HAD superfamily hydrolase